MNTYQGYTSNKPALLLIVLLLNATILLSPGASGAAEGKLIGTSGLNMLEGSGGGGIVPWATLSGYDSRDEIAANAFFTNVNVDDFRLNVVGASVSLYDRVELSVARHTLDVVPLEAEIEQNIYGVKYRIAGDVVYSKWPQISVGLQHKELKDGAIAQALGAEDFDSGTDFYLAATKVHLGAIFGYNAVWNATIRATKANQTGLLGFGHGNDNEYDYMFEGSAGVLLSRHLAIGVEYRQKPDNLGIGEQDWKDLFIAWIPNKRVNMTMAWAELGNIAGLPDQQGIYFSINAQLW